MSVQTWTPAPKKGIIPLHPLSFGTILGKAFAALRHNPRVLFGFAVMVQLIVVLVTAALMGVVLFTTFSRLETLTPASPDFEAVLSGTIAINIVAAIIVALASVAFTAMVQGVVAADIGFAAIGTKATLRMLWRRMAPSFWRLAAYSLILAAAVFGVFTIAALLIVGLVAGGVASGTDVVGVVILVVVIFVLGSIPLYIWLGTKLLLVPSILVLERARLREAIVRSWRLTRGRFWVAFGVTALIGIIMGTAMQVVSIPASFLSPMLIGIVAPTGDPEPSAILGMVLLALVPQILVLALQAVAQVVQSTGGALVYLDCRMRYEGLDHTLIAHVERREEGWDDDRLGDPYAVDPARAVTSAPPPRQVPEHVLAAQGYAYPPQGYAYPPQVYGSPVQGYAAPTPQGYAAPTPQGYAAPTPQGYAAPPPQGYGSPQPANTPPAPQNYAAPSAPQGYATPPPTGYAPPAPDDGTAQAYAPAPAPPAPVADSGTGADGGGASA